MSVCVCCVVLCFEYAVYCGVRMLRVERTLCVSYVLSVVCCVPPLPECVVCCVLCAPHVWCVVYCVSCGLSVVCCAMCRGLCVVCVIL